MVELPGGSAERRLVLGVRPESLELAPEGVSAAVEVVEELGADAYMFCIADVNGKSTKFVARIDARQLPARGDRVTLRPRPGEIHVFDAETGERLSV